ncbi:tetratricopeptide repeat protein [Paramagnetospirillum magneticum]|nr:toll/interleukin-1 receptor domain-containing protein [Paramagnetospirillum magneticum]
MADFFISYTYTDLEWARWVDFVLREAGYDTVIQEYDFRGNFITEMDKAVDECDYTLALLSPKYRASVNCQREWSAALAADPDKPQGKLLPLRVVEMEVTGLLGPIIWHDLATAPNDRDAERRLFEAIKGKVRPSTRPAFPGRGRNIPAFPGGRPAISNLGPRNPHFVGRVQLLERLDRQLKEGAVALTALAGLGGIISNLGPRNPHFVGRVQLLERLDRQLKEGAVALTALAGLGGIGKSQTAQHYAHSRTGLEIVWWLRAERLETMLGDLAELARRLGVAPEGHDLQQRARAALDELARRDSWLLVYDNAEDEDSVRDWLPQGGGAVIITSRESHWGRIPLLEVDKLARAESVELLLDLSGDTDTAAAAALAHDLDDLPLALEQAAAFAKVAGWTLARYGEEFTQAHARLLQQGKPVDYPATVATTWDISVRRVEEHNPAAAQLLTLCAFLAADDIPLDLLRPAAHRLPSPLAEVLADPVDTAQAVAELARQSLVKAKHGMLSLHRLVQLVQRNRLSEDECRDWTARAFSAVYLVYEFKENDLTTWEAAGLLLPHAEAVAGRAETAEVEWRATSWLLDKAGECLIKDGLYERAIDLRRRALSLAETKLPADDPPVATLLNNLAIAHYHAEQWAEALPLLRRALAIYEAQYGPDRHEVAATLGNLAMVYLKLGDLPEAHKLTEQALTIGEAHFGLDHPTVAVRLGNFANSLDDMGKPAEAEPLQRRALEILIAHFGEVHPLVAGSRHNLAMTLTDLGRLEEAREMMGKALSIRQTLLAADHPLTILARGLLAEIDARIARRGGASS